MRKAQARTRVGVFVVGDAAAGGSHQYELSILEALIAKGSDLSDRFSFALFYQDGDSLPLERLRRCGWTTHARPNAKLLQALRWVASAGGLRRSHARLEEADAPASPPRSVEAARPRSRLERSLLRRFFRRHAIDLLFCAAPTPIGFEVGVPYVMAIHDLQHRLQPEFPEVSAGGEWMRREYLFRNAARRATLLIADSEIGKEDIVDCYGEYGVSADAVVVLPFVPPPYLEEVPTAEADGIRQEKGLPERFFFYPAQFWPHKNHARIVEAIGVLKEHALDVHVAFTGSRRGGVVSDTASKVATLAENHRCSRQIHLLPYLDSREISALYGIAQGLVMPTFFGPTNIPILEAWLLGCPVITSDIRGVREQVGDAGLLVDPTDPVAIAEAMRRLATDEALRDDLRRRGRARLSLYTKEDFAHRLTEILSKASAPISARNASGMRELVAGR